MIRTIVFWGLYWGTLTLGNYRLVFKVQGVGFRVRDLGLRVYGLRFRVEGLYPHKSNTCPHPNVRPCTSGQTPEVPNPTPPKTPS